jgi:hypothetical protein
MSNKVLRTKKPSTSDGSTEATQSESAGGAALNPQDSIAQKDLDVEKPTRYILVTCRSLNVNESKVLSKNFKNIILFDPNLHAANTDLNTFTFDLLMINVNGKDSHLFLEIVTPQARALNIPVIVVKKSASNYKHLVEALGAYVVSRIEDLDGDNFFNFLVKEKIPKLENRIFTFLKSC